MKFFKDEHLSALPVNVIFIEKGSQFYQERKREKKEKETARKILVERYNAVPIGASSLYKPISRTYDLFFTETINQFK